MLKPASHLGPMRRPLTLLRGTIIDEVNRESTVLRFASSALCRHNAPNTGDGSTLGHYLAGFRLAQNAIDAKALYSGLYQLRGRFSPR